jgi:hypothetical protein
MTNEVKPIASSTRYLHEALFSLNISLTIVALVFLYSRPVTSALFRMDYSIHRFLHLQQTDLHYGNWAFFLPGTALALCIMISLHFARRAPLTREILRSAGGIAALCSLPAYWLCAMYSGNRRYGWNPFHAIQLYEAVLVLLCVVLYLGGEWRVPWWGNLIMILLHYGFWFRQFGTEYLLTAYGGPITLAPIAGLSSTLAWILYVRCLQPRRVSD